MREPSPDAPNTALWETPASILSDRELKELTKEDPFTFTPFVETLASLALNRTNKTPYTVVVEGEWGTGKTTLMQSVKLLIDGQSRGLSDDTVTGFNEAKKHLRPCKTVWFNAWKYSCDDHILVSLLLELFNAMEKDDKFWDSSINISRKSFMKGARGIIQKFSGIDISESLATYSLQNKAPFLNEFTDLVKTLIHSFTAGDKKETEEDSKGAFVIFIDDLDRCPPSRVVQVLEAIKLFLDTEGCLFFLGMEVKMVEEAIKTEYEERQKRKNFDAARYLEKIFQLRVNVPPLHPENLTVFVEGLLSAWKTNEKYQKEKQNVCRVFSSAPFHSQRSVKRAINDFLFLDTLSPKLEASAGDGKKAPSRTSTGLAKWIVINTLEKAFKEKLLANDMELLAKWEELHQGIKTKEDFNTKVKEYLNKVYEDEHKTEQYFNERNQATEEGSGRVVTDIPWVKLIEDNQKEEWFYAPYLTVGDACFQDKESRLAYRDLNRFVTIQEEAKKEESVRLVNGYCIPPGSNLRRANLAEADLMEADLMEADLTGAKLTGANLRRADLTKADLIYADLRGANLAKAKLTGADLTKANLRRANLTEANLAEAKLTEADLMEANLTGANLIYADLTGADLTGALFRITNLGGANFSGVNLTKADFIGVNLTGARYNRDTLFPEGLDPEENGMHSIDDDRS